jgi:hypothetical protein
VLYVLNPTRQERPVAVDLPQDIRTARDVWQDKPVQVKGRRISLTLSDRDVAVVRLN